MTNSSKTAPSAVKEKWPPLHDAVWRAAYQGDLSELDVMLKRGADVSETADSHTSTNTTVLHNATDGSVELVDLLLESGARELLEEKCGPGEEGRWSGHTALQMAARKGRREIARRLIASGANYDVFSAIALGDLERVLEHVQQNESQLTEIDDYQATLLHWAASQDQHVAAEFLIERGADVDAVDVFDETPLLVASARQAAHLAVTRLSRRRRLSAAF